MKCFYHFDGDGKSSAAIVRKALNGDITFIEYDYGDFPYDAVNKDEMVILVDCSCDFERLMERTSNITWIDHHKTAIDKWEHLGLAGIRRDGTAACELTWEYLCDDPFPMAVKLFGAYDVWNFEYGDDTMNFQLGAMLHNMHPEADIWNYWLDPEYNLSAEIFEGDIIRQYRENTYKNMVKDLSFACTWQGYKCICCNTGSNPQLFFRSIDVSEYDLLVGFTFDGSLYKVSLRTPKDIDVSAIAKEFGGGGHVKAAGFRVKELPFRLEV